MTEKCSCPAAIEDDLDSRDSASKRFMLFCYVPTLLEASLMAGTMAATCTSSCGAVQVFAQTPMLLEGTPLC